jgi:hypothetical protein
MDIAPPLLTCQTAAVDCSTPAPIAAGRLTSATLCSLPYNAGPCLLAFACCAEGAVGVRRTDVGLIGATPTAWITGVLANYQKAVVEVTAVQGRLGPLLFGSLATDPAAYGFRVAVHDPSVRPSTVIRPLAEAPSNHPASRAFTGPGAPSLISCGQLPTKVSST